MTTPRPSPGTLPDISFPAIPAATLANGLTVLTVTDHRLPRVSIKLALPAGRTSNPDDNGSLVELTAELLKEGAGNRSAVEAAAFMDRWAIDYDAQVMMEQTVVSVTALGAHLGHALEFLADVVLRPHLSGPELERLKTRLHGQLISQRSSADFLASERLFLEFFGSDHPYRRVSFTAKEMAAAGRDAIVACRDRVLQPSGALLLMAGDIEQDQAVELAGRFFSEWPSGTSGRIDPPSPPPASRRVVLVDRPHSQQARLAVGLAGLPRNHPDWHRLRLMNRVLGGGGSARLFLNLREDKGYTYGIYSYLRGFRTAGMLIASSDLNSESVAASIEEVFAEMERLADEPPGSTELERARSEIVGSMLRRLETAGSVGTLELSRRLFELDSDYYDRFVGELRAVTAADVQVMASRILQPDNATIVAVGDRATLLPQLESLGPVSIVDQEGAPLEAPGSETGGKDA